MVDLEILLSGFLCISLPFTMFIFSLHCLFQNILILELSDMDVIVDIYFLDSTMICFTRNTKFQWLTAASIYFSYLWVHIGLVVPHKSLILRFTATWGTLFSM